MPLNRFGAAAAAALVVGASLAIPTLPRRSTPAVAHKETMTCVPQSRLFGTPPAGFEYTRLEGEERREYVRDLDMDDGTFGRPEVTVALGGDEDDTLILVATRRVNAAEGLQPWIDNGRRWNRDWHQETIAGHAAVWFANEDGSRLATAIKGCHFITVIALGDERLRRAAATVFST